MHKNAACTRQCCGEADVWLGDDSEAGAFRRFPNSPFSTCGPSWRLARNSANAHSVNLVGMVHCIQSVSFSDFDRFLCKSVCCVAEGAVVNFLDRLRHFSILCRCHMFNTLHLCSRMFVLVPTIREYTRGVRVFWQVYCTACRSSRRQSADYFFANRQNFSLKMFAGSVALTYHCSCATFQGTNPCLSPMPKSKPKPTSPRKQVSTVFYQSRSVIYRILFGRANTGSMICKDSGVQ